MASRNGSANRLRSVGSRECPNLDPDLVGRKLEEGPLTVTLSEGFYGGETFDA
jgi:hypothetical protein